MLYHVVTAGPDNHANNNIPTQAQLVGKHLKVQSPPIDWAGITTTTHQASLPPVLMANQHQHHPFLPRLATNGITLSHRAIEAETRDPIMPPLLLTSKGQAHLTMAAVWKFITLKKMMATNNLPQLLVLEPPDYHVPWDRYRYFKTLPPVCIHQLLLARLPIPLSNNGCWNPWIVLTHPMI